MESITLSKGGSGFLDGGIDSIAIVNPGSGYSMGNKPQVLISLGLPLKLL